ncbi:MAG: hypothetical protein Dasosvirus1_25 [Dasosvirus sp.]|uniref:Uncharacterized protein n=1 Tax=Dasosvirus sp. TaxID=2487764 RepID=A0A3G4ZR55_9VIRU|nr:MAG: hypothetical protein Dasosvirus1_25 [Dasosvirus sp.]
MNQFEKYYRDHINDLLTYCPDIKIYPDTKLYYSKFIDMNASFEYKAFWLACFFESDVNVIKKIVETSGIDPNTLDFDGDNGFMMACNLNPNLEIIKYLTTITTKPNLKIKSKNNFNASILACCYNNQQVVQYLFEELKFDPNELSSFHDSFLNVCCRNRHLEVFRYFVETLKIYQSLTLNGENGLMVACMYNKNPQVIQYLIECGKFDLNAHNKSGETIFDMVQNSQGEIRDFFIKSNYFILSNVMYTKIKSKLSQEQLEIYELKFEEKLDKKQKEKFYRFIVDSKLQGYCTNDRIIEMLGPKMFDLAKNGLVIAPKTPIIPPTYVNLTFSKMTPNSFTVKDAETRKVMIINGTTYYCHRDLLLAGSQTYRNLNSMIDKKGNIEFTIPNVDSEIVEIFLLSFYDSVYREIKDLDTEKLLGLCELVDRLPNTWLTIEKLEYYLVNKFDDKYRNIYERYIKCYPLYHLNAKLFGH